MFGFVTASLKELTDAEKSRYNAVYCGICRQIRQRQSNPARLALSYDMAFLALLLTSLYEPEQIQGSRACLLHPIKPKPWVDNVYVRYAAELNVALAYYNCLDDWKDDRKLSAKLLAGCMKGDIPAITERYPRQCGAISRCLGELNDLERQRCANPDEPANCFGRLMAELMVFQEDLWAPTLRAVGFWLGRFIYLADAVADLEKDRKKGSYNPFCQPGSTGDPGKWEEYLVLAMGRCTEAFEKLPLVQDKPLLDNILYSGVWMNVGRKSAGGEKHGRSL